MPIVIEGGPSVEYEQANAEWASLVTATIQTAQERERAEKLWQSGKRSEAMAILQKNPNVGIEYRALVGGEVVASGSYFGKDAADFLNGISMAVDAGLLSPVTKQSGTTRHHSQNPVAPKIPVTPGELEKIRGDVEKAITAKRCADYLKALLDEAAVQTGEPYRDIMVTFDNIKFAYQADGDSLLVLLKTIPQQQLFVRLRATSSVKIELPLFELKLLRTFSVRLFIT